MYNVRLARAEDIPLLGPIELAAGRLFVEIGMADVADGEPTEVEALRAGLAGGHLWGVADDRDAPVGFALTKPLDGCLYLNEISVHPEHGRRGLGSLLLDAVAAQARAEGFPGVTLSTFRDVPWNGPWYHRYGFRDLREDELTPGLLGIRSREAENGLDVSVRVFMLLRLEG